MSFFQYIPLFAAVANLILTILVVCRDPRPVLHRVFGVFGLSLTIWNLGTFCMFRVNNAASALFYARFLQFGVIFIPITLFHLSLLIGQVRTGPIIRWLYALAICLALSNFTGLFIAGVRDFGYAYYSIAGPGFWIFSLTLILLLVSVPILIAKRRQLPLLHKRRLTPLIIAQSALIAFGCNDVIPILGIDYYPFTQIQVYPLGSLAAVFYGLIVGYSVLQHQLLDVQVTLGRAAAHLVRLTFLFAIGITLLLLASILARNQFTPVSFLCSLTVLLLSSLIASFFFPRIFGGGGEALERRLLGDRFEYHVQVRGFISSMQKYTDHEMLLNDLEHLLVHVIGVASYQILMLDEASRAFSLFRSFPQRPSGDPSEIQIESPIFRLFAKSKAEYIALNTVYVSPIENVVEREARGVMRRFDAEFCFPFFADLAPFGLLLIGVKSTGDPYTATDVNLLVALVKNLSLFLNQARLKDQIMLAQELDLLGRMSRGMAHDLNNLLTPMWTLLQLANEGTPLELLRDELLPLATRNIETMRTYIREALFFSKNLRPNFQLGRMDMVVAQAVELASQQLRRKDIKTLVDMSPDTLLEMDAVLIQRLIVNLLSNAIDASSPGAHVHLYLSRMPKAPGSREWLRLAIIDEGEGIAEENLARIFTPYFTTKDRGDENRGFGLGLSICRRIVNLHGGNLSVASKPKKGTTVNVDLPLSQSSPTIPLVTASAK